MHENQIFRHVLVTFEEVYEGVTSGWREGVACSAMSQSLWIEHIETAEMATLAYQIGRYIS